MYTGGVSSLAEQIANQLQSQEDPKPLPEKRDLVSMLPMHGVEGMLLHRSKPHLPMSVVSYAATLLIH